MSAPVEKTEQKSSYWDSGPGPAGVMLPPTIGYIDHDKTRYQMPAYSLGLKLKSTLIGSGLGPGPIYAIPVGMTAKGPSGVPAYTMRVKTKLIESFNINTPGPAAYSPEINVNRPKAPEFSITSRRKLIEKGYASPGPIYLLPSALGSHIPDKPAAPEITLKSRGVEKSDDKRSPGPIYDIGRPDLIKWRAGEVSMKGDRKEPTLHNYLAGPGSYNVAESTPKIWRAPPSYSLGIRHSKFAGTMLTECDKLPF